jgi:hypothetical protein
MEQDNRENEEAKENREIEEEVVEVEIDEDNNEDMEETKEEDDEKEDIDWIATSIQRTKIVDGEKQYLITWKPTTLDRIPTSPNIVKKINRHREISQGSDQPPRYLISWNKTWELISNIPTYLLNKKTK